MKRTFFSKSDRWVFSPVVHTLFFVTHILILQVFLWLWGESKWGEFSKQRQRTFFIYFLENILKQSWKIKSPLQWVFCYAKKKVSCSGLFIFSAGLKIDQLNSFYGHEKPTKSCMCYKKNIFVELQLLKLEVHAKHSEACTRNSHFLRQRDTFKIISKTCKNCKNWSAINKFLFFLLQVFRRIFKN